MKKGFLLVVLLSAFLCEAALAVSDPRAPWTGLWRILQQTQEGPAPIHLYVPPGETPPTLYDASWQTEIVTDWKFEEKGLQLTVSHRVGAVQFRGIREGDSVKGEWKLLHPQYESTDSFQGERVFPSPRWGPFEGANRIEKAHRLIDLAGYLEDRKGLSADEFARWWGEEIHTDFYVFLDGAPSAGVVFKRLQQPGLEEKSRKLDEVVRDLRSDLRKLIPDPPFRERIVTRPFGGSDMRALRVGDQIFLLIDLTEVPLPAKETAYRSLLAREVITTGLRYTLAGSSLPSVGAFRAGLPVYVASRLGYSSQRSEVFGFSEQTIREVESRLDQLKKSARDSSARLSPEEAAVLGVEFIEVLSRRFSLSQLLEMTVAAINREFLAFLAAGPPPAP